MSGDIEYGQQIIRLEAEALSSLAGLLDQSFERAVEMVLACDGQVVLTGMGKSGIVAQKISATFASTGTRSIFLHPAEAMHGDLGRVAASDLVIALSRSGEAEEIRRLIPWVKRIGSPVIAVTAAPDSTLAQHSDCLLYVGQAPEACPIGLAPTTSTTAQLALGDALSMTVAKRRNFTREEYAEFHPGGSLGRSLLRVSEIMSGADEWPPTPSGTPTRAALEDSGGRGRRPGALPVVDSDNVLCGLLTDGDVRRHILEDPGFLDRPIDDVMTPAPTTVTADQLAAEAWRTMEERNYDELPVVDADGRYVGLLDVQDLLAAGIAGTSKQRP